MFFVLLLCLCLSVIPTIQLSISPDLPLCVQLQVNGTENIGNMMTHQCNLAKALAARIDESSELERMAPVALNIVCFRYVYTPPAEEGEVDAAKVSAIHSW